MIGLGVVGFVSFKFSGLGVILDLRFLGCVFILANLGGFRKINFL